MSRHFASHTLLQRLVGGLPPTLEENSQAFDFHTSALLFDGVDDFSKSPNADLGFGNSFTISFWLRPNTSVTSSVFKYLLDIRNNSGSNENSITIRYTNTDKIEFQLNSNTSIVFKDYTLPLTAFFHAGAQNFYNIVITWSGSSFLIWRNGVDITSAFTFVTDVPGTQLSSSRAIALGSDFATDNHWDGYMHSVAMWNNALSLDEIRAIWNQGKGTHVNLNESFEAYASQPVFVSPTVVNGLLHWYRFGYDVSNPLKDYGPLPVDLSA